MNGISIIIPTYNEEKAILDTIRNLHSTMSASKIPYQIIVVNDSSKDRTREVLESNGGETGLGITLVHHETNRGYGAAIKTGSRHATFDTLCITDSDGTYPNDRIPDLYAEMAHHDMVVGARIGKNVHIPWLRRAPKAFINMLASYVANERIPDLNSGLRVFSRELFDRFINLYPNGFSLTSTITLAALTNDYSVKYMKIDYFKREGSSKIRPIKDTMNFVMLILRMCMLFNPLRIFIPLSAIIFLLGVAILAWGLAVTGKFYDGTFITLTLGSIQFFCLGLLADAVSRKQR
jgi:glycosyltransferase involved in cell wall biosynthesis